MPLFMDVHTIDGGVSATDVDRAHIHEERHGPPRTVWCVDVGAEG